MKRKSSSSSCARALLVKTKGGGRFVRKFFKDFVKYKREKDVYLLLEKLPNFSRLLQANYHKMGPEEDSGGFIDSRWGKYGNLYNKSIPWSEEMFTKLTFVLYQSLIRAERLFNFLHNDIHGGNIVVDEDESDPRVPYTAFFIDFELSSFGTGTSTNLEAIRSVSHEKSLYENLVDLLLCLDFVFRRRMTNKNKSFSRSWNAFKRYMYKIIDPDLLLKHEFFKSVK